MPVWEIITVAVVLGAAGLSAFVWHRMRDAIFLVGVTAAAWLTAQVVGLPVRVAIITAAYGGLGALALRRSRRQYARAAGAVIAFGVPLVAAWSEASGDSVSGVKVALALLTGAGWIALSAGAWMWIRGQAQATQHPSRTTKIVAVVNPSKFADGGAALRRGLRTASAGLGDPQWVETTTEDPGDGVARAAVDDGAELVIACGGDGTVRACADGLAGSGVPLGIIPSGTGNLLARNLGVPLDAAEALKVALHGRDRLIDLGRVDDQRFAVMAGIGFDAALVADASDGLKKRMGWPAYFLSGARHLLGDVMKLTISLDDGPALQRRARGVLIGNVGRIQGGIPILPDASPDDGLLDVVVLAPRGLIDWTRVGARVLARRRGTNARIERFTAKKVSIRTERPHPRQLDGETIAEGTRFDAEVEPAALIVRVPARP